MEKLIGFLGIAVLTSLILLVFTYPEMLAINYVFSGAALTAVFGVAKIGFWKTFVLSFITAALFKTVK